MKLLFNAVVLSFLLAYTVEMSNGRSTQSSVKEEKANVTIQNNGKISKLELHFKNIKRPLWVGLASVARIVQGKNGTKTGPPDCDEVCKEIGVLLRKAYFFAAAYCTFSRAMMNHGKDLTAQAWRAKEMSKDALAHYIHLQDDIVRNEPRIKLENETELKQNCDSGVFFPCGENHGNSLKEMHVLKCLKPCKADKTCKSMLKEAFLKAETGYEDNHDEMEEEIDEEEDEEDEDEDEEDDKEVDMISVIDLLF